MAITAKQTLGAFLGATLAATPMVAANAQDAMSPANTNVTASTIDPLEVQYLPAQDLSEDGARMVAANASRDKVAIVVWGGNRTIQQEAYNAARDLVGIGIPTAFVLGPDHNNLDGAAVMQVYAASTPRADGMWGIDNADQIRANMREQGLAAYREAFPAQLAQLSLR